MIGLYVSQYIPYDCWDRAYNPKIINQKCILQFELFLIRCIGLSFVSSLPRLHYPTRLKFLIFLYYDSSGQVHYPTLLLRGHDIKISNQPLLCYFLITQDLHEYNLNYVWHLPSITHHSYLEFIHYLKFLLVYLQVHLTIKLAYHYIVSFYLNGLVYRMFATAKHIFCCFFVIFSRNCHSVFVLVYLWC